MELGAVTPMPKNDISTRPSYWFVFLEITGNATHVYTKTWIFLSLQWNWVYFIFKLNISTISVELIELEKWNTVKSKKVNTGIQNETQILNDLCGRQWCMFQTKAVAYCAITTHKIAAEMRIRLNENTVTIKISFVISEASILHNWTARRCMFFTCQVNYGVNKNRNTGNIQSQFGTQHLNARERRMIDTFMTHW